MRCPAVRCLALGCVALTRSRRTKHAASCGAFPKSETDARGSLGNGCLLVRAVERIHKRLPTLDAIDDGSASRSPVPTLSHTSVTGITCAMYAIDLWVDPFSFWATRRKKKVKGLQQADSFSAVDLGFSLVCQQMMGKGEGKWRMMDGRRTWDVVEVLLVGGVRLATHLTWCFRRSEAAGMVCRERKEKEEEEGWMPMPVEGQQQTGGWGRGGPLHRLPTRTGG